MDYTIPGYSKTKALPGLFPPQLVASRHNGAYIALKVVNQFLLVVKAFLY